MINTLRLSDNQLVDIIQSISDILYMVIQVKKGIEMKKKFGNLE